MMFDFVYVTCLCHMVYLDFVKSQVNMNCFSGLVQTLERKDLRKEKGSMVDKLFGRKVYKLNLSLYCVDLEVWSKLAKCVHIMRIAILTALGSV